MFYRDELNRLLKDEKNIVNRMYINEIDLQLRKYEAVLRKSAADSNYYQAIAEALTVFTSHLENPKYHYNKTTKNGFKRYSPLLSSLYIDDFISSLLKQHDIIKHKGVSWGRKSFTMDFRLAPKSFDTMEKELSFSSKMSPVFLQLVQTLDTQFRLTGKKLFQKCQLTLPLITFNIYKNLLEEDLIKLEYYAKKAKETFKNSKMVVICETIDPNISFDFKQSAIDVVFILRQQKTQKKLNFVHADVIRSINEHIKEYLYDCPDDNVIYEKTGILK
jgi:hypothetical protein